MAVTTTYEDPRAHAVRERYLGLFGGDELPVPVEAIAEDLLGLRVEESWDIDCSGMLLPAERRIVLNAHERVGGRNDPPLRRFRFTIAHEIGHWVCHCLEGRAPSPEPSYCRPVDLTEAADRTLEREANVFAAELLMPEAAVRTGVGGARRRRRLRRALRRLPDSDAVAAATASARSTLQPRPCEHGERRRLVEEEELGEACPAGAAAPASSRGTRAGTRSSASSPSASGFAPRRHAGSRDSRTRARARGRRSAPRGASRGSGAARRPTYP